MARSSISSRSVFTTTALFWEGRYVVRALINEPIGMGDHGRFVPLPDSMPQDIPPGQFRAEYHRTEPTDEF